MSNINQILADQIITKLKEASLIDEKDTQLFTLLSSGTAKDITWKQAFEKVINKPSTFPTGKNELNKLYIKSFRGATQPITVDFDNNKNITMLFAENGNGKSTIADALICLCTDRMGSLDDKSSVDKAFYKSLGAKEGETKIAINY